MNTLEYEVEQAETFTTAADMSEIAQVDEVTEDYRRLVALCMEKAQILARLRGNRLAERIAAPRTRKALARKLADRYYAA